MVLPFYILSYNLTDLLSFPQVFGNGLNFHFFFFLGYLPFTKFSVVREKLLFLFVCLKIGFTTHFISKVLFVHNFSIELCFKKSKQFETSSLSMFVSILVCLLAGLFCFWPRDSLPPSKRICG